MSATVRVLPHELMRVLDGFTLTVDGDVQLRLFTAEEFLEVQHAACDKHSSPENRITIQRARELVGAWQVTG